MLLSASQRATAARRARHVALASSTGDEHDSCRSMDIPASTSQARGGALPPGCSGVDFTYPLCLNGNAGQKALGHAGSERRKVGLTAFAMQAGLEHLLDSFFKFDDLSQLVLGICVAAALFSVWSIIGSPGAVEYSILVIVFLLSVILTVTAANLIFFYLAWEIAALCAWGISRWSTFDDEYSTASFPIQGAGALGSLCMLLAILLLAVQNRSLAMTGLFAAQATPVFLLLLTALFLKSFGVIAQGWRHEHDKAYGVSRGLVASAGALSLGIYPYLRLFGGNFAFQPEWRGLTLWYALPLAALIGLSGLVEDDIYRAVSSASFAQFCLLLAGLTLPGSIAYQGALLGLVAYGLGVSALFACTGVLESRSGESSLASLKGLGPSLPLTASLFAFGSLAFAGLPPTAGFISRLLVGGEYLRAGQLGLFLTLVVLSALILAINLRVFWWAFLGHSAPGAVEGHWPVLLATSGILCLLVLLGLRPEEALRLFPAT